MSCAPYRRCTSQPASSILTPLCLRVPRRCADRYILRNTRKIPPTVAWYLSHALPDRRSTGRWCSPSPSLQLTEILRCRSAYNSPPPEASAEVRSHRSERNRTYHSVRSGSAHPSNADGRIPSLSACSWSSRYRSSSPLRTRSSLPWRP